MRVLEDFRDPMQAELLRLLLEQNGICVSLAYGGLTNVYGVQLGLEGTRVMVAETDFERAQSILAAEKPAPAKPEPG